MILVVKHIVPVVPNVIANVIIIATAIAIAPKKK
jgi:hypothetical protein